MLSPKWKTNHRLHEDILPLKEYVGFNYLTYISKILEYIDGPGFIKREYEGPKFERGGEDWTLREIQYSLKDNLSESQVGELRGVLKKGFREGWNIVRIRDEIQKKVKPENLTLPNGLVLQGNVRSVMMARTETVRSAAQGFLLQLEDDGIEEVQWIATFSENVCPYCDDLNGTILTVQEASERIPAHVGCRCFYAPVIRD